MSNEIFQAAKMASSRTRAQNTGPRAQNNGPWVSSGFIDDDSVECRLATQTVTTSTSYWQVLSEVKLRRIFDVCKRRANSSFACICKKKEWFHTWGHVGDSLTDCVKKQHDLGLAASAAGLSCIFTLAVREPPVLASCIEIYYLF